jgi:hypothetical protein
VWEGLLIAGQRFLIGLALGLLEFYTKRADLRREVRLELENGMLRIAQRALNWKVVSLERGTGTELRVRDTAGTLVIRAGDPDT